jgi:tol-pal system protein YbgF
MVSDMLKYMRCSVVAAALIGTCLVAPAMAQSAPDMAVRMSQMEDEMRQLMGQVEQLTFEVKQLKAQIGKTNTGAIEQSAPPVAKPTKLANQQLPSQTGLRPTTQPSEQVASEQGVETIEGQPLGLPQADGQSPDGAAPGPRILGSLAGSNAAASPGDGGYQGQVLVAPGQQEPGDDAAVMQGNAGTAGNNPDSIQTVSLSPESPEALYEHSNEALLRRQFGDAEAGFRTFIQKYPDHSLAGSAQYWLGETYYAQNQFKDAAQAFLQGYRQYPNSRRAADSLLKLGISLGRLGQKQQACSAYAAVSNEYPKAVEARKRAQAESKSAGCPA